MKRILSIATLAILTIIPIAADQPLPPGMGDDCSNCGGVVSVGITLLQLAWAWWVKTVS